MLSSGDPYAVADLDHVSEWPEGARALLPKIVASGFYIERSPSGDGLHVWMRARLGAGVLHKKRFGPDAALEVYDRARVLTVTGAVVDAQTVLP